MKWKKLAHFLPEIPGLTHAACPIYFEGQIYFSPRDRRERSHIYKCDFNLSTLKLGKPYLVISPGSPGEFDDYGAMVSWICRDGPRVLMYYVGWNIGISVPFRNSIGLAVDEEKTIGPILDRNRYDPILVGSCCTLRWYLSALGWVKRRDRMQPMYHIVNGHPHSPAITFKNSEEYAIAKPCVIQNHAFQNHAYEMFYCYRGDQYRLGYATSHDGIQWQRFDEQMGISLGEPGDFDDEAQCYAHVFDDSGKRYMFYNGNGYGKTGFGLAVMQ